MPLMRPLVSPREGASEKLYRMLLTFPKNNTILNMSTVKYSIPFCIVQITGKAKDRWLNSTSMSIKGNVVAVNV